MSILHSIISTSLLLPLLIYASKGNDSLVVTEEPGYARPYVLPHYNGFRVQAAEYTVGFPVTNQSTNSALSILTLNGPVSQQIPVHYHALYHETFFVSKGAILLFVQNETRRLGPLDMASVPINQNHSFQLLEPDTEVIGSVAPGGFPFYQFVGTPYAPANTSPFGTPAEINNDTIACAIENRAYSDYNPTDYQLNFALDNGTTNAQLPWHNGNNTLPNATVPYYIAGGWGPKYLQRDLGQVVSVYMSTTESSGNLTIATIAMRAKAAWNETIVEHRHEGVAQALWVLEGQLLVEIEGETAVMATGDVAVIPAGFAYKYWSKVAFTKVYSSAAPVPGRARNGSEMLLGLVGELVADSEEWGSAVFPVQSQ